MHHRCTPQSQSPPLLFTPVAMADHIGNVIDIDAEAGHDWVLKWVLQSGCRHLQSVAATCKGRHTEHIKSTSQQCHHIASSAALAASSPVMSTWR